MKSPEYAFSFVCIALSLILVLVALFNLGTGIVYDTHNWIDTLFIFGAAWRVHQGLTPVLDFGHHYGGFIPQTLGWAMSAFGDTVSVFYAYSILMGGFLVGCAAVISRQGLSFAGFCAVVLVVLTLVLTRYQLEWSSAITGVGSGHSFFYNRYGQAAMVIVAVFVALRSNNQFTELTGGLVVGVLIGTACLTKSTFVVTLPGLLIALLILRRWSAIAGACAGLAAFILAFDPTLARFFGSLNYALEYFSGDNRLVGNSVPGLIRMSVKIPLAQPVALALAGIALAACLNARACWWPCLSIVVFAGSLVGMTATMGGFGSTGHLVLPTLAGVAIGCAELARGNGSENVQVIKGLAAAIVFGFTVPHVLNAAAAGAQGYLRQSQLLIEHGPYARYLNIPKYYHASNGPTHYQMLADGIEGLDSLGGDASQWGIVANGLLSFEHAMRAKPVAGYPLWQDDPVPEFAADRPLSDEIDVILISRLPEFSDRVLRSKMTSEFALCSRTELWEIYTHERLSDAICPAN